MKIKCMPCQKEIDAQLITGKMAYPYRSDLIDLRFFQCPHCFNFVGTHEDNGLINPVPLGCIVGEDVRKSRIYIHKLIDPVWKSGRIKRRALYRKISNDLKYKYHTANIETIDEARKIYKVCLKIIKELKDGE